MIRVIDDKPHPSIVKQVICRNCGSTLEYTPNDVTIDWSTDYTGSRDASNYINCPKCSKRIGVK
jgi:DNA-directed RNA polymerase subunit RPC12/RpoP